MGKLYVVGLGPGARSKMTIEAADAIEACDVVVGYTVYIDLVKRIFPGKECVATPMKTEVDRVSDAISRAEGGQTVALVCSGDSGVYGMASLALELAEERGSSVDIDVVAGVSALSSGAAILGAPLTHDFAVISLSDLLTPQELIERRLRAACEADFTICLYNPASRGRPDSLKRACAIMLETKSPSTVCGIARNIGRDGEEATITTLADLADASVDMFCTVFVGSSRTRDIGGRMVTPRGYAVRGER